jgi:hypothetical protein
MPRSTFAYFLLPALLASSSAFGWGAPGHEFVGAVADRILDTPGHAHAKAEVSQILGFDLKTAATWPDCARSVKKTGDDQFQFQIDPQHPEYTAPCTAFETPGETARMEDYARRNWNNCTYEPGHGCHESYHFADIAEQRGKYVDTLTGANPHDIVHAIDAAIVVLQGGSAPAPFSIKDKKEALLLIAHFIGDLHQPLHVGAVYLDANGQLVDPDAAKLSAPEIANDLTHGGNAITQAGGGRSPNLHAQWDEIPPAFKNAPSKSDIDAAKAVPKTTAPVGDLAAIWASDTVAQSQKAFAGLSFRGAGHQHWNVVFANHATYVAARADLQHAQLLKGGARLAELLNDIWP